MTIEKLLECTPEELEKLSDQQLNEFFAPYLKFVRPPEQNQNQSISGHSAPATKNVLHVGSKKRKPNLDTQMEMLEELAKKKGLL